MSKFFKHAISATLQQLPITNFYRIARVLIFWYSEKWSANYVGECRTLWGEREHQRDIDNSIKVAKCFWDDSSCRKFVVAYCWLAPSLAWHIA